MDKIRIMGFHQPPPPPLSLMTLIPKRYSLISHHIHQKMRIKDVEMITLKRLAQFIGQKSCLRKSYGIAAPPFSGRGLKDVYT